MRCRLVGGRLVSGELDEPVGPAVTRGPVALLRDRRFGPFVASKTLSTSGVWIQNIAAAVLMFELTGSAFMVGMVSVLQFIPPLLFSLAAGALIDQFDRRKMLMTSQAILLVASIFIAAAVGLRGADGITPMWLMAAVFVTGTGLAIGNPAIQAIMPSLVPSKDLEQALAMNAASPSIARTLGPAAGAGLLVAGGPALGFAAAASCHAVFVLVMVFVRPLTQPVRKSRPSLLGGWRYLRGDRRAAALIAGVGMLSVGADPVITLTPSLAAEMGGGDGLVGVLATAFGAGAIVLTATLRIWRRYVSLPTLGGLGFWLLGAGLVIVAASPWVPLAVAGFVVGGAGFMMGMVALNTRVQRRVPDELRGRVMAFWTVAFFGSRPVAAALNGAVADWANVRTAIVVAAVLTVLSARLATVTYGDR